MKKNQGHELYELGRLSEALEAFNQAIKSNPSDLDCFIMLGVIHAQMGNLPDAIAHFQYVTRVQPASAVAWSNLGLSYLHANQHSEAETCLRHAITLDPKNASTHNYLGALYHQQGKADTAILSYREALRLRPRDANVLNNLGGILQRLCRTEEAIDAYRRALKAAPGFAQAEFNLGSALQSEGKHQQCLYHYRKALQLNPDLVEAKAAIALLHEKEGHFVEASEALLPYLRGEDTCASVALAYATVARQTNETGTAIELLETIVHRTNLARIERQEIEYALGDLYDLQNAYDTAFEHYRRANSIRSFRYNREEDDNYLHLVRKNFPAGSVPTTPADAEYPPVIFIVGMPRSSTSLVEQILASHPKVHGGGELPYVGNLMAQSRRERNIPHSEVLSLRDPNEIHKFSARYLKKVRALNPEARYITDKMPHNFLHLGMLALAFPNVRIVHCRRNPLDNCLSIYFHNFNANHSYSTDLADLGYYYRNYEALMAHWHRVLGEQILDITYEDLLTEQKGTTQRLLDFCGLNWDDRCIAFHETKRIVNTPSYDQVRRPLYKTSWERWRNYEKHLAPLMHALNSG